MMNHTKTAVTGLTLLAAASVLLAVSSDAHAQTGGNVTFATDYVFRGVSQTAGQPTVQGALEWTENGFYAGAFAANVSSKSYNDGSIEVDLYGGWRGTAGATNVDVGLINFRYPGARTASNEAPRYDTLEFAAGVSWGMFSLKYNYALSDFFSVGDENVPSSWSGVSATENGGSRGSAYIDLTATLPLGTQSDLVLHVGHQTVKHYGVLDYADWRISYVQRLARPGASITIAAQGTDADDAWYSLAVRNQRERIADDRLTAMYQQSF